MCLELSRDASAIGKITPNGIASAIKRNVTDIAWRLSGSVKIRPQFCSPMNLILSGSARLKSVKVNISEKMIGAAVKITKPIIQGEINIHPHRRCCVIKSCFARRVGVAPMGRAAVSERAIVNLQLQNEPLVNINASVVNPQRRGCKE